jgi:DNA repair protein RadC
MPTKTISHVEGFPPHWIEIRRGAKFPAWEKRESCSSSSAVEKAFAFMRKLMHEEMHVVSLDARQRVMHAALVSSGGVAGACCTVSDVFRTPVLVGARGIVLVHNHPSGDPTPSKDDDILTNRVSRVGELMGIPLLDHVIIGESYYSYCDKGGL